MISGLIPPDSRQAAGIVDALHFAGFETLESDNGEAGLDTAVRARYDLLLLDLVLPGRDGLDILREVRETRPSLPVIILTARGEEADRVQGLRLGADDYVVKPFSVKELLARIEVVLRRSPERPSDVAEVQIPGGVADLARSEVGQLRLVCEPLNVAEVSYGGITLPPAKDCAPLPKLEVTKKVTKAPAFAAPSAIGTIFTRSKSSSESAMAANEISGSPCGFGVITSTPKSHCFCSS